MLWFHIPSSRLGHLRCVTHSDFTTDVKSILAIYNLSFYCESILICEEHHSNSEDRWKLSTRVCIAGSASWIIWYIEACVNFGHTGGTNNLIFKLWALSLKYPKIVAEHYSGWPCCLLHGCCLSEVSFFLAASWSFCCFMGCWWMLGAAQRWCPCGGPFSALPSRAYKEVVCFSLKGLGSFMGSGSKVQCLHSVYLQK